MYNELDPTTVFSFAVDLKVLKCHGIETQPYLVIFAIKKIKNGCIYIIVTVMKRNSNLILRLMCQVYNLECKNQKKFTLKIFYAIF